MIAEVAIARGARSSRSDLELALRALFYALVVHLVFFWWTVELFDRVGHGDRWRAHVGGLATYAAVVLVLVPLITGTLLNALIERVERREGPMLLWAAALGAGQARDAHDFAFQRVHGQGAWVIIELIGHTAQEPRLVGGRYGRASAVGQTPSMHDIYLEQLCFVDESDGLRQLTGAYNRDMNLDLATRVQEGALSALKTPAPPAPAKVVPIASLSAVKTSSVHQTQDQATTAALHDVVESDGRDGGGERTGWAVQAQDTVSPSREPRTSRG